MKGNNVVFRIAAACAVVFVVLFAACDNVEFTGNRVANPDSFTLEIERMNGTDRHTMRLSAGDALEVRFVTEAGLLTLEIESGDGTKLYSGNGTELTDFVLNVPVDGDYTITVKAKRAKGEIFVKKVRSFGQS